MPSAQNIVHQIGGAERKWLGESDKAFFRGSLFNWPRVDTAGYATVSVLIFPRAPELCGSLLCQDFLAKILICLPSRLQSGFPFVWLTPCGCYWGKASWVLSPFQDILSPSLWYSIKTTHYTAAPHPVPQNQSSWWYCTTTAPLNRNSSSQAHSFTIYIYFYFTSVSNDESRHLNHLQHQLTSVGET